MSSSCWFALVGKRLPNHCFLLSTSVLLFSHTCHSTKRDGFSMEVTQCESPREKQRAVVVVAPSQLHQWLAWMRLRKMPLPRWLVRNDPAFNYPELVRGLKQRRRDEEALRNLQAKAKKARDSGNVEQINSVFREMCRIAYGEDVQEREDFMIRFGCSAYTPQILEDICNMCKDRGIVEIGAGHGQWARALTDQYQKAAPEKNFDFVLAYDSQTNLPLNKKVYHEHTQAARDYFFAVQKCSTDVRSVLSKWQCRGRALMLVYPSPGRMALETIQTYVEMDPSNDLVIYVGEGRGGANASEELFDYLENGDWILLSVMPVQPSPGGKGFEKCFILQKRKDL